MEKQDIARALLLLGLVVFVALFIVFNDPEFFNAALKYSIFILAVFLLIIFRDKIKFGSNFEVYGIDSNWKRDAIEGVAWGGLFIILNLTAGIAIGFPSLPVQAIGKYGTISVLAPIAEEFGFRTVLLFLTSPFGVPAMYAINMATFSLFHYSAYGASLLAMSASFIGAALFAAFAVFVTRKNNSIITAVVTHAIFNTFLLTRYFVIGLN